MITQSQRL